MLLLWSFLLCVLIIIVPLLLRLLLLLLDYHLIIISLSLARHYVVVIVVIIVGIYVIIVIIHTNNDISIIIRWIQTPQLRSDKAGSSNGADAGDPDASREGPLGEGRGHRQHPRGRALRATGGGLCSGTLKQERQQLCLISVKRQLRLISGKRTSSIIPVCVCCEK